MKTLQLIATSIVTALLTGCSSPNTPVQTATPESGSLPMEETPGSTPVKSDSVNAPAHGPDQMVPENTGPKTTTSAK